MKRTQRVTKSPKKGGRKAASRHKAGSGNLGGLSLMASVESPKRGLVRITDFYRPLKKPVTLRLDADVIAWFKKDGRRYQTRINSALRKVMEREMKG
jgi:uncharacterized protein (DUF4415 family)